MTDRTTYVQSLPGLDLTIERATDRTPDVVRYHVYRGGELVESYRRLPEAQARFRQLRDESGWQPPRLEHLDAEERMRREADARGRSAQIEHWHRVSNRRGWFKGHRV
jgi:hypothetical protein